MNDGYFYGYSSGILLIIPKLMGFSGYTIIFLVGGL